MKALIALDVDGTITVGHAPIEPAVIAFLNQLVAEGFELVFITGRPFALGYEILKVLPFSYYFAPYNGAMVMHMPEGKVIAEKYLNASLFGALDAICAKEPTDYVLYTVSEGKDVCYYRPHRFERGLLKYLQERKGLLKEEWLMVDTYKNLPVAHFPAVKCFGSLASTQNIAFSIEKRYPLHAPIIKDPFNENFYVLQLTDPSVSKGATVKLLSALLGQARPIIAAGDDNNDISMLNAADICIVMASAPEEIQKKAHVIAPKASAMGIIAGLKEAISKLRLLC